MVWNEECCVSTKVQLIFIVKWLKPSRENKHKMTWILSLGLKWKWLWPDTWSSKNCQPRTPQTSEQMIRSDPLTWVWERVRLQLAASCKSVGKDTFQNQLFFETVLSQDWDGDCLKFNVWREGNVSYHSPQEHRVFVLMPATYGRMTKQLALLTSLFWSYFRVTTSRSLLQ